ncbi:hypothetical protein [Hyunsoonleella pacifica]|uniref:Adhesin domain-containing protein n=1 Tax=Hyunsoonleella pacifica TaxID=1080224 RepID=A0A4Q9FPG2_9FLAO|nr:hypothetical protein [Hyunsoonleella pacifica]TBN16716.1 hypothetical protein EYD46_08785 [Hyunsoonleella pacifica]
MKQLHYKISFFLAIMLFSSVVFGQDKLSKDIKKTFSLTNNGSLYLENKYGNVFINGWDKDSIRFEISVEVKGKNLEKAKDLLKRINPDFITTTSQVVVKTVITEKNPSFFNKYIKKISPLNSEKANSDINYTIYLPKQAAVEVYNKYGDIIILDWNGKLIADVEHGDLRITDDLLESKLAIKYGKLRANTLNKTNITAKDATISFEKAETLKLDSDGATISLEDIGELDINSNKDDIEISTINNIHGTVKYSQVTLTNIISKVNLSLNLAELRLKQFSTNAPIVNLHQKSSEVYVNISKTNFNFSAELEQGVLRIPKTMKDINSKVLDEKNKIRQIRATYGDGNQGIFDLTGYKGIIIFKEL